jgi:hypothetical protein
MLMIAASALCSHIAMEATAALRSFFGGIPENSTLYVRDGNCGEV